MKATHYLETELGARIAEIKVTRATVRVHVCNSTTRAYGWGPAKADAMRGGYWQGVMEYLLGVALVASWPLSTHLVKVTDV